MMVLPRFPSLGRLFVVALVVTGSAGCQRGLTNYEHGPDIPSEPWKQAVGTEGRGGAPLEKSSDPLNLRNVFMSQKARDIERNLGFE